MTFEVFEQLKQEFSFVCTFADFLNFYNSQTVEIPEFTQEVHTFDEQYNGTQIINETKSPDALYILIKTRQFTIMQPFIPYVAGHQPITKDNLDEVLKMLIDDVFAPYIEEVKVNRCIAKFRKGAV